MRTNEKTWTPEENDLIKRWSAAIKAIGTDGLLSLPEEIKQILQKPMDLKTKTLLLEEIARVKA